MGVSRFRYILKPSIDQLEQQPCLLLTTKDMAQFLGVSPAKIQQFIYNDRIPLPVNLGIGKCPRWSKIELLEWIESGCPRRTDWIAARGQSGWYPFWRTQPW